MSNNESATSMENTLVAKNETAQATKTQAPKAKAPKAKAPKAKAPAAKAPAAKAPAATVSETEPAKEKTIRISKIDKVQSEIEKQFGISEVQFWKFVAKHKPGKMSANKLADSLVQKAFFERSKLDEQLKG